MKKRYIVLDKEAKKTRTIRPLTRLLDISLVSSSELSSKVKSKDIFRQNRGIFFKNLGVSVVDLDEKRVEELHRQKEFILYEEEREFYAVSKFDELEKIKDTIEILSQQVNSLEQRLKEKEPTPPLTPTPLNYTFNLNNIALPKSKYSGKGINIAILDSGFYAKHPDFANRTIEGKSFVDEQEWDNDGLGHGTHCTGVAAGYISLENQQRYGIAYEANIFIGKVLSNNGKGVTSSILDAIDWALEKRCQVISLSLGSPVEIGEAPSAIFEHIGRRALEQGTLIIAASGNDSRRPNQLPRPVSTPANVESIMAVAALDKSLNVAYFSNAGLNASDGGRVDLSAPGVEIWSSYSKDAKGAKLYKSMSGTSMATPHVSGVAALYFEAFPELSATEIWLKLEKESQELQGKRRDIGAGVVQAK